MGVFVAELAGLIRGVPATLGSAIGFLAATVGVVTELPWEGYCNE